MKTQIDYDEKFAEFMADFKKTPEWRHDSFHWTDMAELAYKFGIKTATESLNIKVANIKRYNLATRNTDSLGTQVVYMQPHPQGSYVDYSSVKALADQTERQDV